MDILKEKEPMVLGKRKKPKRENRKEYWQNIPNFTFLIPIFLQKYNK